MKSWILEARCNELSNFGQKILNWLFTNDWILQFILPKGSSHFFSTNTVQIQNSSSKNVENFLRDFFSCIYHRLVDYKILECLLSNLNSNLAAIVTVDKKGISNFARRQNNNIGTKLSGCQFKVLVYLLLCEKFAKSFDNITISSRNVYFFVLATNFNLGALYILLKVSSIFQTTPNSTYYLSKNSK